MVSAIDPTKPVDGIPAVKDELRTNLQTAKDEIEALQDARYGAGQKPADFTLLQTDEQNWINWSGGTTMTVPLLDGGSRFDGERSAGTVGNIVAAGGSGVTFAGPTAIPANTAFTLVFRNGTSVVRVITYA